MALAIIELVAPREPATVHSYAATHLVIFGNFTGSLAFTRGSRVSLSRVFDMPADKTNRSPFNDGPGHWRFPVWQWRDCVTLTLCTILWIILLSSLSVAMVQHQQHARPVDRLHYLDLAFLGNDNSQMVLFHSVAEFVKVFDMILHPRQTTLKLFFTLRLIFKSCPQVSRNSIRLPLNLCSKWELRCYISPSM